MLKRILAYTGAGLLLVSMSGLTAWRLQALLWPDTATNFYLRFGLWLGFILFGLLVWRWAGPATKRLSRQQILAAVIGAVIGGGAGWVVTTPAGLSRLSLTLQADNVWTAQIFTTSWSRDGLDWSVPLALPGSAATLATLEITADSPEIWLISATQADGRAIPLEEFQAEDGWRLQEIDWARYREQPVWLARSPQPAALRWSGPVVGPLTLTFARHSRAGQVTIQWQNTTHRLDLHTDGVEFQGITLPLDKAPVWQASLPLSTLLASDLSLAIQPDPAGAFASLIQKMTLTGIPGSAKIEVSGQQLFDFLHVKYGQAVLTEAGVKITPTQADKAPRIELSPALGPGANWINFLPWLENGLLVLYLAVIGALLGGGLALHLSPAVVSNLNLSLLSLLLSLGLVEAGLRLYLPPADKYFVRHPNIHSIFKPYPGVMPGISGESHFITNAEGIRGAELPAGAYYRILAFGGSTTECLYLDQSEAWPQVVQDRLNQSQQSLPVWVGNVGKSGNTSREHILQFQHLLAQYPNLDTALLLVGGNDLNLRLARGDGYTPDYLADPGMLPLLMGNAFRVLPKYNPNIPNYEQSGIGRLVETFQPAPLSTQITPDFEVEDSAGKVYNKRRQERKNAPIVAALPDLTSGLGEYSRNLNQIIDQAQAHRVRLILLTQPSMYRSDLSQTEQDLLWFGWSSGRKFYYSAEAMAQGMALYNQKLLEVCQQRQVECLDMASALPKDTTVFYDDLHFNESGAAQVAEIVADYLLHQPPFGDKGVGD